MLRLDKISALDVNKALNSVAGLLCGVIIAWALFAASEGFFSEGAQKLSSGELALPDAATCKHGSCWDRAIKWGFPSCTGGSGRSVMGKIINSGKSTCYKSIYFNLESNSIRVFFTVFSYFAVVARNAEVLLVAQTNGALKPGPVLVAWVLALVVLFFSFHDLLYFVNEFYATRTAVGALVFMADALLLSVTTHLAVGGSVPVGLLLDISIATCLFGSGLAVLGPRQALFRIALRLASYGLSIALLSKQSLNLKSDDSKSRGADWGKRFAVAGGALALALLVV